MGAEFTRREVQGGEMIAAVWERDGQAIVETKEGRFAYIQPRVYHYRTLEQCAAALAGFDVLYHSMEHDGP
jgi:hypothetical protein